MQNEKYDIYKRMPNLQKGRQGDIVYRRDIQEHKREALRTRKGLARGQRGKPLTT